MDDQKEKGPGTTQDAKPSQITRTSVRPTHQRIKLLVVLFDGYAKVYADSPASMHVIIVPRCDTIEERHALEVAESRVPLGYRHLLDERLLVGSLNTAVPTLAALQEAEGIAFGLNVMDEAVRRSIASKKARRVKQ